MNLEMRVIFPTSKNDISTLSRQESCENINPHLKSLEFMNHVLVKSLQKLHPWELHCALAYCSYCMLAF